MTDITEIKPAIEIVNITKTGIDILFFGIPDGYKISKPLKVENHKVYSVGSLNNLNNQRLLKQLAKKGDLTKIFTDKLKAKNFPLNDTPNPKAYLLIPNEILQKVVDEQRKKNAALYLKKEDYLKAKAAEAGN